MNRKILLVAALCLSAVGSVSISTAFGQQEEAARLFRDKSWEGAAKAYEAIVRTEPQNGRAWLRLGIARESLGSYPEALEAMKKAEELQFLLPLTRFFLARCSARMGREDEALTWLERAVEADFSSPEQIQEEPAFAALRSNPRFADVLDKAKRNAEPCEHIAEFRQFDFWIGDWNVVSSGQPAGTNHIEKHENGCFLMENWVSVNAGTGKSMNFYDPVAKKWNQIWVDSSGSSIMASGGLQNGAMHFEGDHHYPGGNHELFRMTFTPRDDGSVRQFIEQSKDEGKTWYVWFDGIYEKK
jgi:tetratricopeptide (TPR) repeat protein